MPKLNYDLDSIPDIAGVPPGRYKATLKSCEKGESAKGHPKLMWTWMIKGGDWDKQTIMTHTSLQEHALFGLKQTLTAFGLKGTVKGSTDKLIGRAVGLLVGEKKGINAAGVETMFSNVLAVVPVANLIGIKTGAFPATKEKTLPVSEEEEEVEEEIEEDDDSMPF